MVGTGDADGAGCGAAEAVVTGAALHDGNTDGCGAVVADEAGGLDLTAVHAPGDKTMTATRTTAVAWRGDMASPFWDASQWTADGIVVFQTTSAGNARGTALQIGGRPTHWREL